MPIDQQISEMTHEVLSEELEDYDPEAVQEAADEWVENVAGPFDDTDRATFEVVETEGGRWTWELLDVDDSTITDCGRTFATKSAAFDAASSFQRTIGDASIVARESP